MSLPQERKVHVDLGRAGDDLDRQVEFRGRKGVRLKEIEDRPA